MPLSKPETHFYRFEEDVDLTAPTYLVTKSKVPCMVYTNVDEQPLIDLHGSSASEKVQAQRIRKAEDRNEGSSEASILGLISWAEAQCNHLRKTHLSTLAFFPFNSFTHCKGNRMTMSAGMAHRNIQQLNIHQGRMATFCKSEWKYPPK